MLLNILLFCAWLFALSFHPSPFISLENTNTCMFSAMTNNLEGMLLGRFLVGTGLGVGPPVSSLYVTEVKQKTIFWTFIAWNIY